MLPAQVVLEREARPPACSAKHNMNVGSKRKNTLSRPPTALKRRKQTPTNARIELKPLTHQQRAEVNKVKEAYGDFWRHIKFRHGIEEPLFGRDEVESLLEKAAEIVVHIRSCIDEAQETGLHFRMLCGLAIEYLFTVDFHPQSNPGFFVRSTLLIKDHSSDLQV